MTTTASALDTFAVASPSALGTTPAAEASRRITPVAAVRTLVLAFLILAGSLGATLLAPAEEAAAAGPCTVGGGPTRGTSNGYSYVRGIAWADCSYASPKGQVLTVTLYQNRYAVTRPQTDWDNWTSLGVSNTSWVACRSGALYQVKITHTFNNATTTHWSAAQRMC